MDKLLILENRFIELKNEGKSLEEIADILEVDLELVETWNKNFNIKYKELQGFYPTEKIEVIGKNPADYVAMFSNGYFFTNPLDNIKIGLSSFFNSYPQKVDRDTKERIKEAITAYEIIDKSVSKLKRIYKDEKSNYQFDYETKNNSAKTTEIDNAFKIASEILSPHMLSFSKLIIEQNSNNFYFNPIGINRLPIALKQLKTKNTEGVKEINIQNIPIDTKWIFLTGKNSYGKTSILQKITIGLYGSNDNGQILFDVDKPGRIGVEYLDNFNNIIHNVGGIEPHSLQNLATYGPFRLDLQQKDAQNEISRRSSTPYSIFNSDGLLLNIEYKLFVWKLQGDPRFKIVKELIKNIVPDLHDITLKGEEIQYIEKDEEGNTHQAVPFEKLAAGYKSIIAMVGDMYLRLSKNQADIEPKDLGGIVIIDELDVHLHPKWQRVLPGLLSKAFPKVQFIASTHSPIPFLGAPKNSVFIKVNRSKEEGITAERLDIDVTNLTPNLILTSPIFGMDFITSVNKEKIEDIKTESSYKELKENKELRDRLLEFEKSDRDFPDELFEISN